MRFARTVGPERVSCVSKVSGAFLFSRPTAGALLLFIISRMFLLFPILASANAASLTGGFPKSMQISWLILSYSLTFSGPLRMLNMDTIFSG